MESRPIQDNSTRSVNNAGQRPPPAANQKTLKRKWQRQQQKQVQQCKLLSDNNLSPNLQLNSDKLPSVNRKPQLKSTIARSSLPIRQRLSSVISYPVNIRDRIGAIVRPKEQSTDPQSTDQQSSNKNHNNSAE